MTICLAIVVAVAIKVIGALLIAAMLIIPAAAARTISRTPEAMAVTASIIGVLSVVLGLGTSVAYDTPTGPTIICITALIFSLGTIILTVARKN